MTAAAASRSNAQNAVKIGKVMPMTGTLASAGQQVIDGARLYIKQHGDTACRSGGMEATQSDPFKERIANRSPGAQRNNSKPLTRMVGGGRRLLEHQGSARCEQLGRFHPLKKI
jgi:hypothetical protein